MKAIDKIIDNITMYRLLLYYLGGLLLTAIGLTIFGDLQYNPLYIVLSTVILLISCWGINKIFAYIFKVPVNGESSIITALILALIITPKPTGFNITFLLAASGLAIASKYLLTIRKKHIFNPAAIAVALTALGPRQTASWWIGTTAMLPFVIGGGILMARKIRRTKMVASFFVSAIVATVLYSTLEKANVGTSLNNLLLSSPIFFLGFVMLTEPLTAPSDTKKQNWYGALVGALLPPQVHILSFYTAPELALLVGNVYAYIVSPKTKLIPILKDKIMVASSTMDFVFSPGQKLVYQPGQYMEFTLPHNATDSRGSRRYLTLASSPTESDLRIGVKFYENGSSFKKALLNMNSKTLISASQIAGNFTLPKDRTTKLAFIAGGIGITPFRSMIKYLIDTNDARFVTLLYSARSESDIAYKDVFEVARRTVGVNTYYGVTDENTPVTGGNTFSGFITADIIKQAVPDYNERIFYISGTHQMVNAMQTILRDLGVNKKQIKIDFFPGYA